MKINWPHVREVLYFWLGLPVFLIGYFGTLFAWAVPMPLSVLVPMVAAIFIGGIFNVLCERQHRINFMRNMQAGLAKQAANARKYIEKCNRSRSSTDGG